MASKIFSSFVLLLTSAWVSAQSFDFQLELADSLFMEKKFTQSLEVYRQIYDQGAYSPAMLLKMAYVEEGLGHTARSLYYLDKYYLMSRDDRALEKMEET